MRRTSPTAPTRRHHGRARQDALEPGPLPVVEVHLSDIPQREERRARSVVSPACAASIRGHGVEGYREALELLTARGKALPEGESR